MKKNLSFLMIIILGTSFIIPRKVDAVVPVIDIPTETSTWLSQIKEYGVDTATTIITQRLLKKMVDDSMNWALGGFDGDPSFVNNWDGFLNGVAKDTISAAFDLAQVAATKATEQSEREREFQIAECIDNIDELEIDAVTTQADVDAFYAQRVESCESLNESYNTAGALGSIAQANYNLWQSGEAFTARSVANTIVSSGSKSLNIDPLTAVIEGEGDTLKRLLGTQQNVDQFYNEIGVGGWAGYLALADPHNYPAGLQSVVKGALGAKTTDSITSAVDDIQTPQKFFNKTECEEWAKNADGSQGECIREVTLTPGDQVGQLVQKGLGTEQEQAKFGKELSDVIAKAVGRLTDGLLQKGLGAIGTAISSKSSSQAETAASQFNQAYTSEYDILGLSKDETLIGEETLTDDGEVSVTSSYLQSEYGSDGSTPYIGGPEDLIGLDWNEGPEIIVDLQEVLEPAIVRTEKELEYYTEMEIAIKDGKENIISLDRCLPGPNYDWEQRFSDLFDTTSNNDDAKENRIAFNEMKKMVRDSNVNIPGSIEMISIITSGLSSGNGESDEINRLRIKKQNTLSILKTIEEDIQLDFDNYKKNIHSKLPLFQSEWDGLPETDKISIIEKIGFIKEGETGRSTLINNEALARNSVLDYSWNLWRTEKGKEKPTDTEPSGRKQKSNIRYKYYIIRNDISTEAQVLEAEIRHDGILENNTRTKNYLDDCIQLKSFVTGYTKNEISNSLISSSKPTLPTTAVLSKKRKRTVRFLLPKVRKTDSEIKKYLEEERAKQGRKESSAFKTTIITGGINSSILKYNSQSEIQEYFDNFYPEEDFPDKEVTLHAKSVSEIFEKDYGSADFPRNGTGKGFLYCRLITSFDHLDGKLEGDQNVTNCIKDWYYTDDLDYEVIFSGI